MRVYADMVGDPFHPGLWRYVGLRFLPTPELRPLRFVGRIIPYVPRLLAIHLGVSLLAAAVTGHFLTHDLEVEHLTGGVALLLFGGTELLGHLPVYGVFLTLLAYGSNERTAALVRRLPPVRARLLRRPALAR
jgi:hypothetical protein